MGEASEERLPRAGEGSRSSAYRPGKGGHTRSRFSSHKRVSLTPRPYHSRKLENPSYMRGCKSLDQEREFQPHVCANFAELRDQSTKVDTQIPSFKSTSGLNRPLQHSRVVLACTSLTPRERSNELGETLLEVQERGAGRFASLTL